MNTNRYGEFECPTCGMTFHDRKKLSGHMGGAHRRNITEKGTPRCKKCNHILIEGGNWAQWAVKQRNLICTTCKNVQNKKSYRNRVTQHACTLRSKLLDNAETTLEDIKRRLNKKNG
jgi:uncharacterized C2H2 Zn-finger protein